MTEKEKKFAQSIMDKIKQYSIPTTFNTAISYAENKFVINTYVDGSEPELIDIGIEKWLCKRSPYYFISKYTEFVLPGVGEISSKNLYYFQREILKDFQKYKKIVLTKTRQCLTEDNYVNIKGKGYISIKDVRIGDFIETLKDGESYFTEVLDFIPQGKRKVIKVHTGTKFEIGTPDHKVFTKNGWKENKDLSFEDELLTADGYSKINGFQEFEKEENVYDITTGTHDFLANGILVHNCGMSTLTSLIFFWKLVNFRNQWLVIISKDGKSATEVLEKVKHNIKNIPPWFGIKEKINNVKSLGFTNNSHVDSFARSKSAGRGTSPTMALLDEAAFYQTASIIEGIVSSVVPSLTRTGGQLFVVSTPNGSAEGSEGYWYYKQVKELQEQGGRTKLNALYDIDWWEVPDFEGIRPYKGYNNELGNFIKRDYFNNPDIREEAKKFFAPIAKDYKENEWLKYQYDTSGEIKFRQEILKDFVIVGNTVFSADIISKAEKKIMIPISQNVLNGKNCQNMWIWKEPQKDTSYTVSIDVAKGSSNDSSSIQVIDNHSGEQVAEYLGQCTTKDLAKIANETGKYYNNAYMIVECNSIGEAVFTELYYNLNYPNLYRQKKTGKNGIVVWTGWMTTTKSRDLITDRFIDYYYDDTFWNVYRPHSERLISQMKHWIWQGGRPDHTSGEHDDAIMAMAIGLFNKSDASRHMSGENDVVFVNENGEGISAGEIKKEGKYYDTHDVLNRGEFIKTEEKVYKDAGIPNNVDNANDFYKWLIS